mmetsp:Transcript_54920/g.178461  ORF Transcript_54920/g.178461 Transcript_54920/m.178461 type:complete len:309 (-) Transcript_54920:1163-2089(-)
MRQHGGRGVQAASDCMHYGGFCAPLCNKPEAYGGVQAPSQQTSKALRIMQLYRIQSVVRGGIDAEPDCMSDSSNCSPHSKWLAACGRVRTPPHFSQEGQLGTRLLCDPETASRSVNVAALCLPNISPCRQPLELPLADRGVEAPQHRCPKCRGRVLLQHALPTARNGVEADPRRASNVLERLLVIPGGQLRQLRRQRPHVICFAASHESRRAMVLQASHSARLSLHLVPGRHMPRRGGAVKGPQEGGGLGDTTEEGPDEPLLAPRRRRIGHEHKVAVGPRLPLRTAAAPRHDQLPLEVHRAATRVGID